VKLPKIIKRNNILCCFQTGKELSMKETFPHEKIKVIAESTKKQLKELELMRKSGEISHREADEYQRLVLDVLFLQKDAFCA
jgi:hypothetical protein